MKKSRERLVRLAVLLAGVCVGAGAQEITGLPAPPTSKGHVSYTAEVVEVIAGKPAVVELKFRVDDGFHVNSHTPGSDLLIPTMLKLESVGSAKVLGEEYPRGAAFHLTIGDGELLDVYQGEFRIRLKVLVPRGQSMLQGGLRYQACDSAACFPARTLAVNVAITGK